MKLQLTVNDGTLAGRVFELESGFLTIGRGENCSVRFDPTSERIASKQHAFIEARPDGYYITEAVTQLLKAGYWVRAKKVYMERYGLPQRRKRVVVVGNREKCEFDFPEETHGEVEPGMLFSPAPQLSVLDAISDMLGAVESGEVCFSAPPANDYQRLMRRTDGGKVTLHTVKQVNATTAQRIRHLGQAALSMTSSMSGGQVEQAFGGGRDFLLGRPEL